MDFVLIYSFFVGAIFVIWILFVIWMYHKMQQKQ
jgi:hypothetical protein